MSNPLSLLKREEFKKYFFNTSWMMGERIFSMGLAMVVSIFVARHLGPENFGILSYALSLASLFAIATHMGLSGLAVRELVNKPAEHEELMGTIFGIKSIGALIALIAYLFLVFTTGNIGSTEFWVLLLVAITILSKPFLVIEFWFQAKVKAKYSSIVWGVANVLSSLLKIVLVVIGAHLIAFASVSVVQAIVVIFFLVFFFKKEAKVSLAKWKFSFLRAKDLLSQGWMIMLGAIFGIVYLKIDQVMLRWLVSAEEVGIYSVAAKISEAWYFVPAIIVSSLFPKLLEFRKKDKSVFKERLQQLFDLLFVIGFMVAIIVTFVSQPLIDFLYGTEFGKAGGILSIHVWAGLFISMRAAFSKWILVEDAIVFSVITAGSGALANVILNLIFIPLYGGFGAAFTTLISYSMASYIILFFYKKTRTIFWMMSKSLLYPARIIFQLVLKTKFGWN